jgi:O-antigen ligase
MIIKRLAFYLLLFLVFTIPWQNVVILPMLGTISRLAGFLVVGVAILYILASGRLNEPSLFLIIMTLFVGWSLLSYFWSINPGATIGRFVTNVQLLAMAWLIWELCRSESDRIALIKAYILGAYVSIGDMVITYLQGTATNFRIAAANFDPNDLATTLAIGIPLAYYLINKEKNKLLYIVSLLYIPFALFGIVLTASRGGLVVAMIALTVIPLTFFKINNYNKRVIIIFFVLCIIFIMLWLPDNYQNIESNIERITETPQRIQEGDLSYRNVIWKAGWNAFKESPIIGVGSRGFRHSVEKYLYTRKAPHNAYLSVLVDTGVIGFLLFMIAFVIAIAPNIKLSYFDKITHLILFATLVIALVPLSWEANKNTWFLLSLFTLQYTFIIRNNSFYIVKNYLNEG